MSEKVEGLVVREVSYEEVPIKRGPRAGSKGKVYHVLLSDGERYNSGFKKPDVEVGDTVSFNWKISYGQRQIDGTISTGGMPSPDKAPTYSSSSPSGRMFPVPLTHPDRAIIRQNSLAHASRIVSNLFRDSDSLPLEEIADVTIEMAKKFEEYSSGYLELKEAERMMNMSGDDCE